MNISSLLLDENYLELNMANKDDPLLYSKTSQFIYVI